MGIIEQLQEQLAGLPEVYLILGGVAFTLLVIWWSEWLSKVAIGVVVRLFRLGGRRGPTGRELASRMLAAAGEAGVEVDTSVLDSDFRRTFGDIDYQPGTGVLELTEDKARGSNISSAGLVTLEVGRALQYRSRSVLVFIQRVLSPFVNFAGFAWIWPGVAANLVPVFLEGPQAATVEYWLYVASSVLLGLLLLYMSVKVPLELDAARRGVSAMKRARVFSGGEALAIRIFLALILGISVLGTILMALNIFRATVRSGRS